MPRIDKKLWYFLLLIYGFSFLYGIGISFTQKYFMGLYQSLSFGGLLAFSLYNYIIKFLFIVAAIFFTKYLIDRKTPLLLSVLSHLFLSLAFSGFSSFMLCLSDAFLETGQLSITWNTWFSRLLYSSNFNLFIYLAMIAIVYAYYYLQERQNQQIQQAQLQHQLLDSRMQYLQARLNPHFLFNTLNGISALVDDHQKKAQEAIADLSEMLRYTLEKNDTRLVPLEEEIQLSKKYLRIQQLRFDDKLYWNINASDELLDCAVPPLLFQPIQENAIIHGFGPGIEKLTISVKVQKQHNKLNVRIINSGKAFTQQHLNFGTGLSNVIERLQTLYADKAHFELRTEGGLVVAEMVFPIKSQKNSEE